MPLSDAALRNATPRDRPFKVSDAGGLYVLVNPIGSRLWRFKYRYNGREKLLALGSYPLVGLKLARQKRDEARLLLVEGRDPSAERQAVRRRADAASASSFAAIADEYIEKLRKEGRAQQTLAKTEWLLGQARGDLGRRDVAEIGAPEVLAVLRRVERRGQHETANRLRSTIGAVMRYAIATGRASADPTEALRGALIRPQATPRAAILRPRELGRLLLAIDAIEGQPSTRLGLQLLALLAPRPGELRLAAWSEFDPGEAVWRIPGDRTKMRRPHRAPLPRQAVALIEAHARLGTGGDYMLVSRQGWRRPLSENTLNAALARLGYGTGRATAHGFRASFSTIANESGLWNPDAIERALGHIEGNDVRRAYARGEHWEERVRLAQWWADQLDLFRAEAAHD